jgi:hypothetical protein
MNTIQLLTLSDKQEIFNGLQPMENDTPEYEGERYSDELFEHSYKTENFWIDIEGCISFKWSKDGEYKVENITASSVTICDHDGNEIENEEIRETVSYNLETTL